MADPPTVAEEVLAREAPGDRLSGSRDPVADPPSPWGTFVCEFGRALRQGYTYDFRRNRLSLLGLLWGVPVPIFAMAIDLGATGWSSPLRCLLEHPIHFFFLAHPALFAAAFGAMGTLRRGKEREIRRLLAALNEKVDELALANEKLKELDHLKARFVANVTHDLKTPLVSILGYTEGILEERFGPLTGRQRDGLQIAVRNVERLQKLIEELLDFERIESGEVPLKRVDFDAASLVHAAIETLRPAIEAKRLQVRLRLPASLGLHGDRDLVARVFQNLLSNAVKFTGEGKALGVEARVGESDGQAFFTVWDHGEGIPTAAHKYLFTRFWQAEKPERQKPSGTGLGLAIVKGILDAHGATIRVVSAEGEGTSIHFTLPLAERVAGKETP
jgi:signal transduction histidine kinase